MTGRQTESWLLDRPSDADWQRWGIDPAWSQIVEAPSHDGGSRSWHVLDTGPPDVSEVNSPGGGEAAATVLCIHGNPTWAYVWSPFLRKLQSRHRVIAIDQLGMGYSERGGRRRYVDRIRDLDDLIVALGLSGGQPLVLAAHDWGGAVAMGWAAQDPRQVAGMILCNTGIGVPSGRSAPGIIRLAASAPMLDVVCRGTPTFVEGTIRLSRGRITKDDRNALRAPYKTSPSRAAIADFVDDIPLGAGHPSERALAEVAERLRTVAAPVLLAWGSQDPVFNDDFAKDLADRFPNATTHRFALAGHLVMLEADVAAVAEAWISDLVEGQLAPDTSGEAVTEKAGTFWTDLEDRRADDDVAIVDMAANEELTFAELIGRIEAVATELRRRGLESGDRVAILTPPGVDLLTAVYGVWRAGGVTVLADRGLGLRGLGVAIRSARPTWAIGPKRALAASRAMRWTPRAQRLAIGDLTSASCGDLPPLPAPDDEAAVLFTSGATGPAKGVRYLHRQLECQRDALAATYGITRSDRLVAAFAPFALYGPALGIPTALPNCDVTKPGQLTAEVLDDACQRINATIAFASPSALANVVASAVDTSLAGVASLRVILSAGAPVPSETLHAVAALAPDASLHTPYGMTEALPIADITLAEIDLAEHRDSDGGVCVGRPVVGAQVLIVPLDFDANSLPDSLDEGETGEILVRAPWVSDGYVGLWGTERAARPIGDKAWHRSGDVGHLDADGRLWVEGRSVHVISGPGGPITPVPIERTIERALGLARVAAVGVGPAGSQQLVVVLENDDQPAGLAGYDMANEVRELVDVDVAAVLSLPRIPVDIRHNAKIDRTAVAAWATDLLAGRRARQPR